MTPNFQMMMAIGLKYRFLKLIWVLTTCFLPGLVACQMAAPLAPPSISYPSDVSPTIPATPTPAATNASTVSSPQSPAFDATRTLTQIVNLTITPMPIFYEPAGCWQPPDDYTRVQIGNITINARTYAMLQQAALLYGGEIDVAGKAIIQGSYSNNSLDSLGVHLGGGAVDISITRPNSSYVFYTEIEPLIRALRTAGFAAWLREDDRKEPAAGLYIHAIAIGDHDLSPAAQEQLTGSSGYLRGYDGQPVINGEPVPDRHGGPLICRWMLKAGYSDLRTPTPTPEPGLAWQERLRLAAQAYEAPFPEDAEKIAISLNFLDGRSESAENICGPLSAAILRDAGLLPDQTGPVQDLKSYWQARPSENGRPWSMFPERDYEVFHFDTPLAKFDFRAWPLQPADFLYTYAGDSGFEHMFIVTEVDAEGRAYTVTNQYQAWANKIWGKMLIQRYLLYDLNTPGAGIIYKEWSDRRLGQTGQMGFDVLRKRGLEAGTRYTYVVRPGDTLPNLVARFGATMESLVQANPGLDQANLQVGQTLTILIPPFTPGTPEPVQDGLP